jgi:hypothetical protein
MHVVYFTVFQLRYFTDRQAAMQKFTVYARHETEKNQISQRRKGVKRGMFENRKHAFFQSFW